MEKGEREVYGKGREDEGGEESLLASLIFPSFRRGRERGRNGSGPDQVREENDARVYITSNIKTIGHCQPLTTCEIANII